MRRTLVVVALLAASLEAQALTPRPPEPGAAKPFRVPAAERFTLPNGLRVTLVPYGPVPKLTLQLAVESGAIDERANEVWLSDLTGRYLREGTSTRSATQIADEAASMGGAIDVNVGAERTVLSADVLSEFGPAMTGLLADMASHASLPGSELPRLKADLARELSIALSHSQQLALQKFLGVLYGDHPYGRLFPDPETLAGFSLEQVRGFYDAHFAASRAHLYVAGRFDMPAMQAAVRSSFGSWKKGAPLAGPVPTLHDARGLYTIDRPGAVQSTIILGMPALDPSSPDYVPLLVTNTLLGGSFSSRITANIREQKGYTYSPQGNVSVRRGSGYWAEQADVTTNVTGPAIKEILGEIDRLQAEPPPPEELRAIQTYMAGIFVLRNSSRAGIIGQLAFLDLHGLPDNYLTDYVARVQAVTPQLVQAMARKYIQDEHATIVVVGDRKVIDEQLEPFRPAP